MSQSTAAEPPATTIRKPIMLDKRQQAAPPAIPVKPPVRPQQFEKKTFEQAYCEAVERLNAAAMNKPQHLRPSAEATIKPSNSVKVPTTMVPAILPTSSEDVSNHYKTTIYNINTINLAEFLKTQRNTSVDPLPGPSVTTVNRSVAHAPATAHVLLSQSNSVRVMAESNKYRQTFSNAYANHLIELTRTAVEKQTGKVQRATSCSNQPKIITTSTFQHKPSNATRTDQTKHTPADIFVLNGKPAAAPFVASATLSNNGNVVAISKGKFGNQQVNSNPLNELMPAQSSKSLQQHLPVNTIRLKPSLVRPPVQEQLVAKQPLQSAPHSSARPNIISIPDIANRPGLTVIVNKPKISSPAPSRVYGKPSVSTPSSIPEKNNPALTQRVLDFKTQINEPKPSTSVPERQYRDPPPAHSTGSQTTLLVGRNLTTQPSGQFVPPPLVVSSGTTTQSIHVGKLDNHKGNAVETALNLDTKIVAPPPSMTVSATQLKNNTPLPSTLADHGGVVERLVSTHHTTSNERSSSSVSNSNQKVARIEKRVNYDTKPSSAENSTAKYQQNVVWKEQPSIKSSDLPDTIDEQKQKLLALLHNANLQQFFSQAQAHAQISKGLQNTREADLSQQMKQINRINLELYKYRIKGLSSSSGTKLKPQDPLAIKLDSERQMKRKEPSNRMNFIQRKRPRLARSSEPYLQNVPCYEVAPRLSRCRECGRSAAARSRDAANIFCRFIAFRKLRYNDSGHMEVAGFADPNVDPQDADTSLWNANLFKVPVDLSVEKSKFLLGQVGYKFCELFHQEKEAYFEHMADDKTIAWKQSVQGVREMCDVCSTTLFNYHWVCSKCGFVVCIDCYKFRKHGARKNDTGTKDRDSYMWLNCTTNREPHEQKNLMLTQIIPSNSLYKLVRQMHGICALLEIPLNCECPLSKESLFRKIKDRLEFIYPIVVEASGDGEEKLLKETGSSSSLTKMISITIKNIESGLSATEEGTICCKVIFGRELSADKNPATEILKRRLKQSYPFEGFQEDIKLESLEDFIKGSPQIKREAVPSVKTDSTALDSSPGSSNGAKKNDSGETIGKDPLDADITTIKTDEIKLKREEEPPYTDENKFKISPKLDWKTFNMIVKQLLKFDKSINISGLFERHLTEKCPESVSLVDFTAEIQVNHTNLQNFLHDFLNEFVFLKGQNTSDNLTDDVQILEYNKYMKKCIEFQNKGERAMDLAESEKLYPNVAHQWLCNGRLLRLLDPLNDNNYTTFHDQWERGQPVMVSYVSGAMDMSLWHPEAFIKDFGDEENDLINCLNGKLVRGQQMKVFWEGFERIGFRLLDERDRPMMLKLKDWPPGDDFAEMMPTRFNDLMKCLPLAEYTRREGRLNLASRLSSFFVRPDLGPKMYSAYGSALHPMKGTTNLHLDVSDAVNVMVYVAVPQDVDQKKYTQKVLDTIDTDEFDVFTRQRIREKGELPGALWHIYHATDADKIRNLLNKIEVERGGSIKPNHDPIHDQKWYLDANLRRRLLQEYNVEGYGIVQCSGDAIFIPAGAPHQVRNLHNCIKVAEDFVSPENISYCFKLTNEFRHLTNTHSNHEDKLQIKNIIYHTVKDAVSCLTNPLIMTKDKIDLL